MVGRNSYRVAYRHDGKLYRLTRIVYGSDGSYYVTAPAPPTEKARFAVITVNYARQSEQVSLEEAVDLAAAEGTDKEIKLSHHPDGFGQFSGAGLVSGRDEDGTIRGIGVQSWPLWNPVTGPAFGLTITSLQDFIPETRETADTIVFDDADVMRVEGADTTILEGHYFSSLWRRFIRPDTQGRPIIRVVHPARVVLELRVLLPRERSQFPGFLGIEVYTQDSTPLDADSGECEDAEPAHEPAPGFMFSGSTGNLRQSENGELLGDGIYCVYPVDRITRGRSLDFTPDDL